MSVVYTVEAQNDLDEVDRSLLRLGGPPLLKLFYQRLHKALALYELMPLAAPEYQPSIPQFPGMRFFPIRKFASYAVFYQPTQTGLRLLRILHTSRNMAAILEEG